jgi:hypothetical protein
MPPAPLAADAREVAFSSHLPQQPRQTTVSRYWDNIDDVQTSQMATIWQRCEGESAAVPHGSLSRAGSQAVQQDRNAAFLAALTARPWDDVIA